MKEYMVNEASVEELEDEVVIFSHDLDASRHRARRRNNALKWRKDRRSSCEIIDRAFAKKILHKRNRRKPNLTSDTYYKDMYGIKALIWGFT